MERREECERIGERKEKEISTKNKRKEDRKKYKKTKQDLNNIYNQEAKRL